MTNELDMAVALLNFRTAYSNLVKASVKLTDYDCSYLYPFYLLDFEQIAPAVSQWCTVHASILLRDVPDKVDNPACIKCKYFRAGLTPSGICKGAEDLACTLYPSTIFTREAVAAALSSLGYDVNNMSNDELYLYYSKEMDINERKAKQNAVSTPVHSSDAGCNHVDTRSQ